MNTLCPSSSSDDLCLFFCIYPSSMVVTNQKIGWATTCLPLVQKYYYYYNYCKYYQVSNQVKHSYVELLKLFPLKFFILTTPLCGNSFKIDFPEGQINKPQMVEIVRSIFPKWGPPPPRIKASKGSLCTTWVHVLHSCTTSVHVTGCMHRVINFIEDKATQIIFGWKFHEIWLEF